MTEASTMRDAGPQPILPTAVYDAKEATQVLRLRRVERLYEIPPHELPRSRLTAGGRKVFFTGETLLNYIESRTQRR